MDPECLAKLRYFYKDYPELPVIAAGSLLDFALADLEYSFPVGRLESVYMGPMSFEEFLLGLGELGLLDYILSYSLKNSAPPTLHKKLMELIRTYFFLVGCQRWTI